MKHFDLSHGGGDRKQTLPSWAKYMGLPPVILFFMIFSSFFIRSPCTLEFNPPPSLMFLLVPDGREKGERVEGSKRRTFRLNFFRP